jgi:penicillin G amidase
MAALGIGKWVRRLLGFIFLLAVLIAASLFAYRLFGLPTTDGTLELAGLKSPVKILRDERAIAHIYAGSAPDAHFALGVVHAQDRLWQLEMNRRIVRAQLSEVLGESALETDRFLRTLGVAQAAEKVWVQLDAPTRESLQAYSDGINQYASSIKDAPWKLSPEFHLVGAKPGAWTPVDSIGLHIMLAWDLSGNLHSELLRMELMGKLSQARLKELIETDQSVVIDSYQSLYADIGLKQLSAATLKTLPPAAHEGVGSNNWVVHGTRTQTGLPLLGNDPHLALSSPSLWYLAHLSAPKLEVVGATTPGLPYVILGRTDRIAWGFTNTEPDSQDVMIERIDPDNPLRYQTPEGWADFVVRQEVIKVKGAADVVLNVRSTRNGPVISDAYAAATRALKASGSNYVLALRWTMLQPGDKSLTAGLNINTARNWSEFKEALRDFGGPQQNIVFADVDGNIGIVSPGRVPIRKPENKIKGTMPVPGWDANYDWSGYIPYDELPSQVQTATAPDQKNPWLFSANQKIVNDQYPYMISSEWTLPYRYDRIGVMLQAQPKLNAAHFTQMQMDDRSGALAALLPRMLKTPVKDRANLPIHAALLAWDYKMSGDSALPLIATAWSDRLREQMFIDDVGADAFATLDRRRGRHLLAARLLQGESSWCDRVDTPAFESCDDIVAIAFDSALSDLRIRYGQDWQQWRWAQAHQAEFEHRPFGKQPLLAKVFNVRVPMAGDQSTLMASRHDTRHPQEPFRTRHSGGFRAIYDLSNLDQSQYVHGTGQSGHVLSPHYRDLSILWSKGEYLKIETASVAVQSQTKNTLLLTSPSALNLK